LEAAGLVEQYVNEDGQPALRLTPEGAQMGRALAMSSEDDAAALLEALLEAAPKPPHS